MEYYVGTNLMNQPSFYRAIDTKGKEINILKYIGDLIITIGNKDMKIMI